MLNEYLREFNYKFFTVEQSFNFGDGFIFKIFGLILRAILGYKLTLTETDFFKNRSYHMIVAVAY
jgi:hypothetical protein